MNESEKETDKQTDRQALLFLLLLASGLSYSTRPADSGSQDNVARNKDIMFRLSHVIVIDLF